MIKNESEKIKRAEEYDEYNDTEASIALRTGEKPFRTYKDSTFRLLFSEPKRAIELYNAVSGENLPPDTEGSLV